MTFTAFSVVWDPWKKLKKSHVVSCPSFLNGCPMLQKQKVGQTLGTTRFVPLFPFWRRERDSNPWWGLSPYTISSNPSGCKRFCLSVIVLFKGYKKDIFSILLEWVKLLRNYLYNTIRSFIRRKDYLLRFNQPSGIFSTGSGMMSFSPILAYSAARLSSIVPSLLGVMLRMKFTFLGK